MWIEFIHIENFRNYDFLEANFSPFLNFFIGENATGKTNLLEAISYFIMYKSFRNVGDSSLIQWNKNYFYLKIHSVNSFNLKEQYEVGVEKINHSLKKKIKKNNKKINKISEVFRALLGVFFTPNDLIYIESLADRRNFFDFLFSSIDDEYFQNYIEYQKCLKQRNELLKRIQERKAQISELDYWDFKLIQNGKKIAEKRVLYIRKFEKFLINRVKEISNGKDKIEIKLEEHNLDNYENFFYENRIKDIQMGTTTFGIHRDKIYLFDENQKDILLSFSQGQKRTVALSLKLAQYDLIKEFFNVKPILFVDDVIRELDQYRRKYFLETLVDSGQAFFTTPNFEEDMKIFKNIKDRECKIFKLNQGKIENEF